MTSSQVKWRKESRHDTYGSPQQPTRSEIEEHELTHVPFREWCVHCCKGKSRNNAHKVNKDKEDEEANNAVLTVSMDYMYLNDKGEKHPYHRNR